MQPALWLTIVLPARRDELVALRWKDVDLAAGSVSIRRTYVRAAGTGYDKDVKAHRMRCLTVDRATLQLLKGRRRACVNLLGLAGVELGPDHLVFSASDDLLRLREPNSKTSRFRGLARKLGIESRLHELGHYAADELFDAGVARRS